ncbi:helix-turn-helix domain-containing protein [Streptomyces sp. NPDC058368]|uniref:helix-turn-helix domain-containing protein n=1 Tax=Streptomyces sp. NPDC058368 TaxID=3346461 RepID=UPI003663C9EB
MTTVEDFARHLQQLRAEAGQPSIRQLAGRTGYGKTVIGEAFTGRRLPSWPLVAKLSAELGLDMDEMRQKWAAAKSRPGAAQSVHDWLTSVRPDIPALITGMPFEEACAAAATAPGQSLASAWEVVRVSALQLSRSLYDDMPGSWASNITETYVRAEGDGHLPPGAGAVARVVQHHHVCLATHPEALPSTAEILQLVVLAYRLAWQARDVITKQSG